jgi:hypothetical protein
MSMFFYDATCMFVAIIIVACIGNSRLARLSIIIYILTEEFILQEQLVKMLWVWVINVKLPTFRRRNVGEGIASNFP